MASIRTQIKRIVRNKSWSDSDILDLMNRGLTAIAGGMMFQYSDGTQALSPPLPDLMTSSTVTTSTTLAYVSMPADFQRNLFMLKSLTNGLRIMNLFSTFAEFLTYYPMIEYSPLTCQVIGAARRGTQFWYQGIPTTAESLQLHYFRKPIITTEDTVESECDGLPAHLAEELLISYCAMKIWTEIESGVGAQLVNTKEYKERLNKALMDLDAFIPVQREPVVFGPDSDKSYWESGYSYNG